MIPLTLFIKNLCAVKLFCHHPIPRLPRGQSKNGVIIKGRAIKSEAMQKGGKLSFEQNTFVFYKIFLISAYSYFLFNIIAQISMFYA